MRSLREFPEHQRSLWLATGRRRFESAIARPHLTPREVVETLNTDSYYKLSRSPKPNNLDEQLRNFVEAEFIKDDWEGGYDLTNLGAIMFANDITTFPSTIAKTVRVIRYGGNDKRSAESEMEWKEGYAVGFSLLMKSIMDILPKEEKYDGGVRRSQSVYSEIAIREILANALIHQDFTISGAGPIVEIYRDRIEITNPGNSLIEKNRIINERRSRNEKLARSMRTLGLCEERGGGMDKAILDIEQRYLPTPGIFMSKDSMRVVIFGPKRFNELSKYDKRWSCLCHCVVRWLSEDYMSNTTLRERFALGPENYQLVSAVIADARKAGEIIPADPNQGKRNARYVPAWVGERG